MIPEYLLILEILAVLVIKFHLTIVLKLMFVDFVFFGKNYT